MISPVDFFPGFPLPASDYEPLLHSLQGSGALPGPIRLAHSLGSLTALAEASDLPLVLLAPSTPGRRPGRRAIRAALVLAARVPGNERLAARIRSATYAKYDAEAPAGDALAMAAAAERLRPSRVGSWQWTRVIVLCSEADRRHPAQAELARRLGASVHWVDGGHLFPIVSPTDTADVIVAALRDSAGTFGLVRPD